MIKSLYTCIVFFCCSFFLSAFAAQTDTTKTEPAHFSADQVALQGATGTTVYTGHVTLDQGTTHLVADKVVAYKNKQGELDKIVATGSPAHYTTLPENQTDPIHAYGDTIEYYPLTRKAIIMGNGYVTQAENSLKGPYIIYDMVESTLHSFPASPFAKKGEGSRIILQPRNLPGNKKTDPS